MPPTISIQTGARSGRLVFLRDVDRGANRDKLIECQCDCGNTTVLKKYSFTSGGSKSCGCAPKYRPTYGRHETVEFKTWRRMIWRCTKVTSKDYPNWGGRGITVCPEWLHDFQAFYDHIGPKPSPKYSIDRIDNDGDYRPGNVRWATRDVQNNNRRDTAFLQIGDEVWTYPDAMRKTGLTKSCLRLRISHGYPPEEILAPPHPGIPLDRLRYCGQETNGVRYLSSMSNENGDESKAGKTHKRVTSAISWDATTGYLNIQWGDGQSTSYNLGELDQSIQNALMYFGALARVQQSYTTCAGNPVVAREKAAKLWTQLRAGNWGLRTGEKSHSIVVQALARLLKIPEAEAAARFHSLPVDKRREVSNRSDVVAQIAKMKAAASPQESLESILK